MKTADTIPIKYMPGADLDAVVARHRDPMQHAGWGRMLFAFAAGAIVGLMCTLAFGCSSAYYTDGESIAYGTDVYTQRRFAGKVTTPKGLTFEGEATRKPDAESITATFDGASRLAATFTPMLDRAVAAKKISAEAATEVKRIMAEAAAKVKADAEPKPVEKAGSR